MVRIALPYSFKFTKRGSYDFARPLSLLDWTIQDDTVEIDLKGCKECNYQALSLLVLYAWKLKRNNRTTVSFNYGDSAEGASYMWRQMGAPSLYHVLDNEHQRFIGNPLKPLIAVRDGNDLTYAVQVASEYVNEFGIEFENTLRYILAELLYNTIEHRSVADIPSIIQLTWYRNKRTISFIIADVGIGIKQHLRQAYPHLGSDSEAIEFALRPQVSGTFLNKNKYMSKNNAGVGLFFSNRMLRRLNAEMHIVSGSGIVHISPVDVTTRELPVSWPGTFVNVTLGLDINTTIKLEGLMAALRQEASEELAQADRSDVKAAYYLGVRNVFGRYPEDKAAASRVRDSELMPAVEFGKTVTVDFQDVISIPHSFVSALLAEAIRHCGMAAFKRIRIINALPDIRGTVDFVFDLNTDLS